MSRFLGKTLTPLWSTLVALLAVAGCNCNEGTRRVYGEIEVTPTTIDFQKVAIGTHATHLINIRNNGTASLFIEAIELTDAGVSSDGRAQISIGGLLETDCEGELREGAPPGIEMGDCARFQVRYAPVEFAAVAGVITIVSSDPATPSQQITIAGSGAVPKLRLCVLSEAGEVVDEDCTHFDDPDPVKAAALPGLDFGAAPVGETRSRQVRIFNDGDFPLSVSNAHVASDFADFSLDAGQLTIGPGSDADLTAVFTPQGDGARTGKLVLLNDDLTHPRIELPMEATAHGPKLCVQPADGLDFGAVPVLEERTLTVTLSNCGFVTYDLTGITLQQDTPPDFSLPDAPPALPTTFAPGDSLEFDVAFEPGSVATFTGELTVTTSFDTHPVPITGDGAPATCAGTTRPTASFQILRGLMDITDNPIVQPLDSVLFDATGSTAPRGGATYTWRLVSQPQNGTQNVMPRSPPTQATLYTALDGDYVVELVVGDAYGCDSVPAQATVHVRSKGKVHVQLTWAQSFGDVDLHFIGPNGVFGDVTADQSGSDCFFANCRGQYGDPGNQLDWGLQGTTAPNNDHTDDPTLDIDEMWGNGPENVTHARPFDATYSVLAHYFCSRPAEGGSFGRDSLGPVDATLKIFVNGDEVFAATEQLTQRDQWRPAQIVVSDRGSTVTVVPSTEPITKSTGDIDACTTDTD